ncbi:MAG: DUF29 domain-containing protein [Okeania sp. SIO2G4]|uniref:DUF29 family protein n=1 Tax=unclassified Okeania TaxID=2634635 RepID=UPI0013BB1CA0|nr:MULTISPECIES: DUF29 family protein [unclassified Okeania]NEP71648.1 DUF29 domain-containing protein [Okeania sp. SIO2G5]NEP91743.1 DUF29 domain-containing protein [Okeania sp. SIO2F5]NEQ89570.1 DUF29 domain-containing protein [Okeania sp. SIO2G4]
MTTQELIDLRTCIMEGRNHDALAIIDELDAMSKKDTLFKIDSYLTVVLIHLIKNQVEGRFTNSWAASIRASIRKIKSLNLKENKTSYYIKEEEWDEILEEAIEFGIDDASAEVENGVYTPFQRKEMVDRNSIITTAKSFLALTYTYSTKDLLAVISDNLTLLPGGEDWKFGRKNK